MDERNLTHDIKHDQDYPNRENIPECPILSDDEITESSSSNVSEDEGPEHAASNAVDARKKSSSHVDGISTDSSEVFLEPFVHQVGGHIPMVCLDADTVCKPLIEREHRFYRTLPESLKRFTPQFEGLMHIEMKANPDGCIALTGNPPSSRRNIQTHCDKESNNRRKNKRIKNRQKLHLLLQHIHNGEEGARNHQFEWIHSKCKNREGPKTAYNGHRNSRHTEQDKEDVLYEERYHSRKEGMQKTENELGTNKELIKGNDVSTVGNESNEDLELFYNPWALKCHQEHFKKLGLKSSNTIAISPKLETGESVEPFPKTRCTYLLLENVVSSQVRPCVLDLKVGTRQYPDDCSSVKKKSKMTKSAQTTSSTLGLRLCGMQVFNPALEKYSCLNKYHGRALTDKTFIDCIGQFLNRNDGFREDGFRDDGFREDGFRDDVRKQLIHNLLELKDELKKLNSFRFYTSSLLVAYDGYCNFEQHGNSIGKSCDNIVTIQCGGDDTKGDNFSPSSAKGDISSYNANQRDVHSCNASERQYSNQLVDVRLIDFAHSTHIGMNDKTTYEGPDDNFISGISNFISILQEL